jgi:hypothetical protein
MRATLKYPTRHTERGGSSGEAIGFVVRALARRAPACHRTLYRLKAGLHTFAFLFAALFNTFVSAAERHDFVAEAEAAYRAAQAVYATNQSLAAAIDVSRTAFDYADLAPNDSIREAIANVGISTARAVIATNTNSVAAHYYLALNTGQLARTKMLGALKLLTEMEKELQIVIRLDPKFDYAGGYRTLGVLYLEAPGWPTSVGSKSKARANLEKALELAPEDPDNHLSYMEALAKWHEWKMLTEKLSDYKGIVPAAKQKFTGPDWAYEWSDWTKREQAIQAKLEKH